MALGAPVQSAGFETGVKNIHLSDNRRVQTGRASRVLSVGTLCPVLSFTMQVHDA